MPHKCRREVESSSVRSVTMSCESADGDGGFPGAVRMHVTYRYGHRHQRLSRSSSLHTPWRTLTLCTFRGSPRTFRRAAALTPDASFRTNVTRSVQDSEGPELRIQYHATACAWGSSPVLFHGLYVVVSKSQSHAVKVGPTPIRLYLQINVT